VVRIPQGTWASDPKPGEPQDRQRGATDPQDSMRRKPSRRRETAKVERDPSSGNDGPKRLTEVANPHGSETQEWTQAAHVDGEAIFEQPHERSPVQTGPEDRKAPSSANRYCRGSGTRKGTAPRITSEPERIF